MKEGKPIGNYRRILQREYLNKVTNFVLNPPPATSHDVIAVCRYQLKELDKGIKDYLSRYPNADLMTRAHLQSCSDIIGEALKAVYSKTAK
ncbi:MAG: hypothetical protein OEZ30_00935 [Candidatus Aminicenantes bacterium]|nr:hypothetical protein [Candidatus Aminicenantes bacterium]MDH5714113.1 hypothetical protein [Candidatus Aminicenantes bacterium]